MLEIIVKHDNVLSVHSAHSSSVLSPSYYDGSALQKCCYVRNVFAPARVCVTKGYNST